MALLLAAVLLGTGQAQVKTSHPYGVTAALKPALAIGRYVRVGFPERLFADREGDAWS